MAPVSSARGLRRQTSRAAPERIDRRSGSASSPNSASRSSSSSLDASPRRPRGARRAPTVTPPRARRDDRDRPRTAGSIRPRRRAVAALHRSRSSSTTYCHRCAERTWRTPANRGSVRSARRAAASRFAPEPVSSSSTSSSRSSKLCGGGSHPTLRRARQEGGAPRPAPRRAARAAAPAPRRACRPRAPTPPELVDVHAASTSSPASDFVGDSADTRWSASAMG